MRFILLYLSVFFIVIGCKEQRRHATPLVQKSETTSVNIKYAKGFSIKHFQTHKEIIVTRAWPESRKKFRYLLIDKESVYDANLRNN